MKQSIHCVPTGPEDTNTAQFPLMFCSSSWFWRLMALNLQSLETMSSAQQGITSVRFVIPVCSTFAKRRCEACYRVMERAQPAVCQAFLMHPGSMELCEGHEHCWRIHPFPTGQREVVMFSRHDNRLWAFQDLNHAYGLPSTTFSFPFDLRSSISVHRALQLSVGL